MQDDCPFKDRNRRNPGAAQSQSDPKQTPPIPKPNINPVSVLQAQSALRAQAPVRTPVPIAPRVVVPQSTVVRTPVRAPIVPMTVISRGGSRGRGARGRGRGRGRSRISDESSDSDDPDDPSWRPEELCGEQNVRRSARWAKKINDVMNPEPSTSGIRISSAKKSFTSAELNEKMISCPCCDFMAVFQSVLEDHYIASHKVPNKNACLVCHLKFENTRCFFDHFEQHRKGTLPSRPPPDPVSEAPQKPAPKPAVVEQAISVNTENVPTPTSKEGDEPFDGVLTSIDGANLADPVSDKSIKIPYQAAIHDKNLKDSKLKKFEELKSPNDLITMKTIEKLKHFFKCGSYNCTFTTHNTADFSDHLEKKHSGKRFHCCYCLKEEMDASKMANHIAFKHTKRIYQCSKCFYRAYSKAHVQIHIKNNHSQDPYTEILVCDPVELADDTYTEDSSAENVNTTWPYICAIGQCDFNTFDPKEFKKHNETIHRLVSVFICHYCKVDFLTFKRLMNHYRLHGLNVFQCNYCIHGAENKEEILLHLCNAHADEPLKAYMRGSQEEASSEVKQLNTVLREDAEDSNFSDMSSSKIVMPAISFKAKDNLYTGCENELYHVIDNKSYPQNMQSMCFPKFLKKIVSDVVCGVPFCNEKFPTIQLYASHLRSVHDALNYPCPHCPEISNSWIDFKNHLLCHGSKLYACGTKDCEFYDFSKDKVREHKRSHEDADNNVIALREFSASGEEGKVSTLENEGEFPETEETFTCLFCKYKSGDRNKMKNHIYKEMAYQRFDCSLCEKKCPSRKEIKEHFTTAHPEVDILCSADYNIQVESMVKYVLMHQEKFQDINLAEFCDMCCRKFRNPLRLQSHLCICLQKEHRPYECQHCNRKYANLQVLKYHTDEEHEAKCIEYSFELNSAVEEDIEKNLLKIRLKQLKDIFEEQNLNMSIDEKTFKVKFYTCTDCAFESHHKFNVQRHNNVKHAGKANVMKGRECNVQENSSDTLNLQLDENSNDSTSGKTLVKRYSCAYCVKKMLTIQEVEKHMRKAHTSKNTEFFYYFTPNTKTEILEADKDIYECAYCKSTRENLLSLKKHSDLMHSEMEFKVKGFLTCTQLQNNYLACGYCYSRAENLSQLQEHSASSHPLLALKSIGGFQMKCKRSNESVEDCPNKRVKFNSTVFVCSHCGGAFASKESVTVHSQRAHSRFQLKYTTMEQSVNSAETTDLKFYKCEFCIFTSEKLYLDKHLALKHKMIFSCSYCTKRFEYASKLKEHHDASHKDLPLKYNQEKSSKPSANGKNEASNSKVVPESNDTRYGKKPDPVDLNSIVVHMKTSEGELADLPLVYVSERFNLFPKVVLKDCMKEKQ